MARRDTIFLPPKPFLNIIYKSFWALFKQTQAFSSIFELLFVIMKRIYLQMLLYYLGVSLYLGLSFFSWHTVLLKLIHSQEPLLYLRVT